MDLFAAFRKKKPATPDELQPFFDDFAKAETAARDELAALEARRDAGILELPEGEIEKLDGQIDAAERRLRDLGSARAQVAQRIAAAAEQQIVADMQDIADAGRKAITRQIELFAAAAPLYAKLAAISQEWGETELDRQGAYDRLDREGFHELRDEIAPALSRIPADMTMGFSRSTENPFFNLRLPGYWPPGISYGPHRIEDIVRELRG